MLRLRIGIQLVWLPDKEETTSLIYFLFFTLRNDRYRSLQSSSFSSSFSLRTGTLSSLCWYIFVFDKLHEFIDHCRYHKNQSLLFGPLSWQVDSIYLARRPNSGYIVLLLLLARLHLHCVKVQMPFFYVRGSQSFYSVTRTSCLNLLSALVGKQSLSLCSALSFQLLSVVFHFPSTDSQH
jgi:hypothetical protein